MDERTLAQLFLAVAVGDIDEWERLRASRKPSPDCPPPGRFLGALLREDWTEAEAAHKGGCPYCRRTEERVRRDLWHPTKAQLFWHARRLPGGQDEAAVAFHLEQDGCRRCGRLSALLRADLLLGRLAEQVVRRVTGAAEDLRRLLEVCATSREYLTPPALATSFSTTAGGPAEQRFTFDDGRTLGTLYLSREPVSEAQSSIEEPAPPAEARSTLEERASPAGGRAGPEAPYWLHLEQQDVPEGPPVLLQIVLGSPERRWERLVVLRPGFAAGTRVTEIHLGAAPPEQSLKYVYPVDPGRHLRAEDAGRLRAAFEAARQDDPASEEVWRAWAGAARRRRDLDPGMRVVLHQIAAGAVS
jgi:hypothetical protein